jgi:heme exporter protein D
MRDLWPYVASAYTVALTVLIGLTVATIVMLRHWARRARDEEER